MIAYENFDLRIRENGNGFVVAAKLGTQEVSEPFKLRSNSWDLKQIENGGKDEVERRGSELFKALIRGKVRNLYHQGRGGTGSNAERGLRIRIQIDARNARLRPLMYVPWEILYDKSADANRLIALDSRRVVVRMIESSEPHVEPAVGELKRVLLASANPAGTERLKLDVEMKHASDALYRNHVQAVLLPKATRTELLDRISNGAPQIVHFMGHGSIDSRHGKGLLLLEGTRRASDPLDAPTFASFFVGGAMPRLVILNSCMTAAAGRARTFNAFSSVAAALIAAGLPAVIAMQSTIRDMNAIKFTEALYRALVHGDSIEAALSKARAALSALDMLMLDWAAPVLYVRAQGGEVMERKPSEKSREGPLDHDHEKRGSKKVVSNGGIVIVDCDNVHAKVNHNK